MEFDDTTSSIINLQSNLQTLLKASLKLDANYDHLDSKFDSIQESLNTSSLRVSPLQSLSIANKALETRIKRAVSPGQALIDAFKLNESLQRNLLETSSKLLSEKKQGKRLRKLIKYVDCVDKLRDSISWISVESGPAIQKVQEVVEFLSRTKATDESRTEQLRETVATLRAVGEAEIECMRYEGVLDEALVNLQEEYEGLLQRLRHGKVGGLGSDLEVEVLRRISHTLAANDCLDICIDMFVKIRYKRAAKALMKLSPDYLKTYTPEEIDEMEWETLETAISLWIQHLQLAVKSVLVSEKALSNRVLGNIQQETTIARGITIWPECFIKISDKIMAVFFRFGEGVARSNREPQKLFKLLDMFDSLKSLQPEFSRVFDGEPGSDIRTRFRELEKLLVHASTRVLWEFGLQIEGNHDGLLPPPKDGYVPKLVRYAINYLKNLTVDSYRSSIAEVLKTEEVWKGKGEISRDLVRDVVANLMEAIQRNIESKKSRYKDKILGHVFSMNTYWYIYMRSRNTEVGRILGEGYMKKRYRNVAEESAYLYQKQAWGGLVRVLEREGMGAFMAGFDEMCERHRSSYKIVCDADLREQMKDAAVRVVLPAYSEFLDEHSSVLGKCTAPELIESMLRKVFEDGGDGEGRSSLARRDSNDRMRFSKGGYRRSEFDDGDL